MRVSPTDWAGLPAALFFTALFLRSVGPAEGGANGLQQVVLWYAGRRWTLLLLLTALRVAANLQVLERAGLVSHERRGREVLYVLDLRRLDEAHAFLAGISAAWDRAIERLRRMVE